MTEPPVIVSCAAMCRAALGFSPRPATAEVRHGSFESASLEREVPDLVDLPAAYGEGTRYPVVYFLHGLFEDYDFWERGELTARHPARVGSAARGSRLRVRAHRARAQPGPLGEPHAMRRTP